MKRRRRLLLGVLPLFANLCACPGDHLSSPDGGGGSQDGGDLAVTCSHSCPPCAGGEVCATGLGGFAGHAAACLKRCASSSDCGAGLRCVSLFGERLPDSVCISLDTPLRCPDIAFDPRWHCDFPPGSCKDSKTLLRPFSQSENQTCGSELVTCPTGCDSIDGGTSSAGQCR